MMRRSASFCNVFRFSDVTTRQVMVHRTQVKGVPVDITCDELAHG